MKAKENETPSFKHQQALVSSRFRNRREIRPFVILTLRVSFHVDPFPPFVSRPFFVFFPEVYEYITFQTSMEANIQT